MDLVKKDYGEWHRKRNILLEAGHQPDRRRQRGAVIRLGGVYTAGAVPYGGAPRRALFHVDR